MKMNCLLSLLLGAFALGFLACSDDVGRDYTKLNLDKFDLSDGISVTGGKYWKDTYVGGTNVVSGMFTFSHSTQSNSTFNGFTVSNVADNSDHSSTGWFPDHQFAAMPKGGVSGEGKPYLVNYGEGLAYNGSTTESLKGKRFTEQNFTSWIKIANGKKIYRAHRVSITNTSLAYYAMKYGNSTGASAFQAGDYLKMNIYGVNDAMTISSPVTIYLADFREGKSTIVDNWLTADISSLGKSRYIFFTLESSDHTTTSSGTRMNTPAYFCVDKLIVYEREFEDN